MSGITREQRVEIRRTVDERSEAAALEAIGCPALGMAAGIHERWMRVPASRVKGARAAIVEAGGKVFKPEQI